MVLFSVECVGGDESIIQVFVFLLYNLRGCSVSDWLLCLWSCNGKKISVFGVRDDESIIQVFVFALYNCSCVVSFLIGFLCFYGVSMVENVYLMYVILFL